MKSLTKKNHQGFTLVEIMIVVAIIGLILAIAIPAYNKTRRQAQKQLCIENLTQIEAAKQMWGMETGKKPGDPATISDLIGPKLYIRTPPACPGSGDYDYGAIGTPATCTVAGHTISAD